MGDLLSPLDSFFVHLESPRTPMHMGSIGIFPGRPFTSADGSVRIDELRRRVGARLELVPKLRQRLSPSPLFLLPRQWEDDEHFDITVHVKQAALPPPGSEEQLLELAAEILSWPLCRSRPLWELWIIEGLRGGRVAILEKLHHSVADGLGGVELALVLLDLERRPKRAPTPPAEWHPARASGLLEMTAGDVVSLAGDGARRAVRRAVAAVHPRRTLARAGAVADGLRSMMTPSLLAPRCSLNAPVGRRRRVAVVRARLSELQEVEHRTGTTLNDVLLTAVGGGVRSLHEARGEELHDLQVLVPVGLRHDGNRRLSNAVSAMVVRLPLAEADAVTRLQRVAEETAQGKRHHQVQGTSALLSMLGAGLQPGIEAVAGIVQRQPFINMVVTNVPGPRAPLYAMGARMLEAVPIVPIAGNLSVGIAAFSYRDQFTVGILADRDRCPDVDVLARGMTRAFRDLVQTAGTKGALSAPLPVGRRRPVPHAARAS